MTDILPLKTPDGTQFYPQTHAQAIVGLDNVQDKTFTFTQLTPAATWTIAHGLGKMPAVSVVDSSGSVVVGEVNYTDLNTLIVSFSAAFAGKAYLN